MNASDFDIEFEKSREAIYLLIDEFLKPIDTKLNSKLDDLFRRTEIVFGRIGEYSNQMVMNPNLKIQNKTGYSLSDIN